ncbi:MAG TPA: replication-associated recombination protein A [Luteibaculaceae bacterium]|nr:replication-associated recombination protein A [Luteibaculaceae bacterium]
MNAPLAERMRPTKLDEYVGQAHLAGKDGIFRKFISNQIIPSIILWGPPGVGKTTLASLLAAEIKRPFFSLSAIHAGVKDVREIIDRAKTPDLLRNGSPLLFIDEIHRFSKSQQDSLLGAVERGWITLIGATTENPSFEVIPALLSRCQVYTLEEHTHEDLILLLKRAITTDPLLATLNIELIETDALLRFSGGDARKLLNALEMFVSSQSDQESVRITNDAVAESIQSNMPRYDKTGEQHYDIISAFIKSVRGSDPHAAVYWLARMIAGGEDPLFIARRLLILASEDIGNANPNALLLAQSTFQAVHSLGMPEARIPLSQCTIYLAASAKSNSSYLAIDRALALVRETGDLPVPLALRNAPTKLMKNLNYGQGYLYSHDYPHNFVAQEFLPEGIQGTSLIAFGNSAREQELKQNTDRRWGTKYNG